MAVNTPLSAKFCESRVAVAFDAPVMVVYFVALMLLTYDKATAIQFIAMKSMSRIVAIFSSWERREVD
ncbi:MAG: hypothetical protein A4E20_13550 [Nitrospira sp. SG-bin2]|jgi:hypothetical protein|nr:MAG: hypothetical protein A4E20_13550 [Nitrospira sp. SG-bin2]